MAYETVVTESGLVIAVDDISGLGKIQVVKLDFGSDGAVSGPVALDNGLPVQVVGPATLPVSLARAVDVNVLNASLSVLAGATFPVSSVRNNKLYRSGVSGRVAIPNAKRINMLTCVVGGVDGSVSIKGGDTIVVPANSALEIPDVGELGTNTNTDVIFTGTTSYYVDWEV